MVSEMTNLTSCRQRREDACIHFLASLPDGSPVGTIRFDVGAGRLARLAVLQPFRGIGAGRALVLGMERVLRTTTGLKTWGGTPWSPPPHLSIGCHSQIHAIPFYRKCGYVEEGERFIGPPLRPSTELTN